MRLAALVVLAGPLLLASAAPAAGQQRVPLPPGVAGAAAREGAIRLDGRVDEPAWLAAPAITDFVQGEPIEGAAPQAATEVRVLYDGAALYVAAVLREPDPARIARQLVRRDERGQYDYFEISLDPNRDRRTGYRFGVGASGVQRDVYLYDDVREDEAWDAIWASAVAIGDSGWSVEVRIPLSQLRFTASPDPQSWGVNFARRRVAANELTYFALESRIRHGRVSVFGRLAGLLLPGGARRLEVRPYALSSVHAAPAEAGNPFFDGTAGRASAGLDLRYGLTASHTLDVTLNPDFGQVEVDPAVINLTAFETFFPERRPFFVEDAQIFDFNLAGPRNRLFYSRRIGREPQGDPPEETDYANLPAQTTILGAAKLTGRSAGGLAIGALTAVTAEERGRAYTLATDSTQTFVAQPRTWHGAVRAVQDFRNGASQVGVIATALRRALPGDSTFDFLPRDALGLGLDFEHAWGGPRSRDWLLSGFLTASYVHGSPTALIRTQRASNHYFQRPDATRFAVDSTATSLTGATWRLQLERRGTSGWSASAWLGEVTPGFEVNDLGFMTNSERLDAGLRVSYQHITPGRLVRSYRLNTFMFHNFRHEALDEPFSWSSWKRAYKAGSINTSADIELRNYWTLDLSARYQPQTLSDNATRGGPLMVDPGRIRFEFRGVTDRRKGVVLEPRAEIERGGGRRAIRAGLELSFRPAANLEIELGPEYARETEPAQYVTQTDDLGYAPTFGPRYLFAHLERHQLAFELRLNLTFTPQLTLQLFAQPLLSAGDYVTYAQLARAESFAFDPFGAGVAVGSEATGVSCVGGQICQIDDTQYVDFDGDGPTDFSFSDRDFNVRSLRLNAVLRWEFRPGSTLFLVWQQSREDRVDAGRFDFGTDVGALWDASGDNILIVKLAYWIGL
ncbi:MAG: carbohydrate binding family 9 domain-containing protein [Gemmatimonadota bacterium]|nr:carbohydrate binding family 9 domain-containing protein [Gemmatimonadota bacterium]